MPALMPLAPLMVNPAAAMAAATAIGFGFSTQMAGAFFGALQGAMEASNKLAAALDETPPDEVKPEVDVKPENIRATSEKRASDKEGFGKGGTLHCASICRLRRSRLQRLQSRRREPARPMISSRSPASVRSWSRC
jgi:hypothetical protein